MDKSYYYDQSSRRIDRVSDLLRKEISALLLKEVKEPRIGMVSLTKVKVTKDLKSARVFFSVIGGEKAIKDSTIGLNRASGFIKKKLGRIIKLRNIPDIIFEYDPSLEYGEKINKLLNNLK
jgi:ribosome-binding factor A